jgi:outer membrane receptor protein involved in Fe transport
VRIFIVIQLANSLQHALPGVPGHKTLNVSNIANTDDGKEYYGFYFEDDWKATQKLTLNLGMRWDYFGQVYEMFGAQANFIPGAPGNGAAYLLPQQRCFEPRSNSFNTLAAKDGIKIGCTNNQSLGNSQLTNFSPRLGAAYQLTPKLVVRAGYGWFYDGFENRGYSPNIGENYPFQFNFSYRFPSAGLFAFQGVPNFRKNPPGVPYRSVQHHQHPSICLAGLQGFHQPEDIWGNHWNPRRSLRPA